MGDYVHGTRNGLRRHRAEGSTPCEACLGAEENYRLNRKKLLRSTGSGVGAAHYKEEK